jgi:hypothetical protein
MLYIRLFRDLQKNILPESGRILRLGNHFHFLLLSSKCAERLIDYIPSCKQEPVKGDVIDIGLVDPEMSEFIFV